jgi:uncharacterized membrane protein
MEPHLFPPDPSFGSPWWVFAHLLATMMPLMFWVALVGLVAWLATRAAQPPERQVLQPRTPSAIELLRQRYVLGEIDALTFEEMVERVMASEAAERTTRDAGGTGYLV